ncbi:MAG: FG-GAP repeat domain-containing protein [Bryobacteraceae bacterium]
MTRHPEVKGFSETCFRVMASRGCAFGDFDNDGDLDVLIVNQNEPPAASGATATVWR